MRSPSIFVIGAGQVGGASAAAIAMRGLGRVYLFDAIPNLAVGKAMDINHAAPFFHSDCRVVGCEDLDALSESDLVVLTAGSPRRAGMSRRDLLRENLSVLESLAKHVAARSPAAKVLVVTNPVDILTTLLRRRWPELNIIGMGCSLDVVRFRLFLAEEARMSTDSVSALVIGSHDDNMVPLARLATVGGLPAIDVLQPSQIQRAIHRTRQAGTKIVGKLKTRGSFYAASWVVAEIAASILHDRRLVFPVNCHCRGEYNLRGVSPALPCVVGAAGVERILELPLDEFEQAAVIRCAEGIREGCLNVSPSVS